MFGTLSGFTLDQVRFQLTPYHSPDTSTHGYLGITECLVQGVNGTKLVFFNRTYHYMGHSMLDYAMLQDTFNMPPSTNMSCKFELQPSGYMQGPANYRRSVDLTHLTPGTASFAAGYIESLSGLTANSVVNVTLNVPRSPDLTLHVNSTVCRASSATGEPLTVG